MTNSPAALPAFALEAVIAHDVHRYVTEDDFDPYALSDDRIKQLAPNDWAAWAEAFDICPKHQCDIEICLDDELDC